METLNVTMTQDEAKEFIEYQKNRDTFNTLLIAGVFNLRNGQAVINFDLNGTINQVDLNVLSYKRGKEMLQFVVLK